MQALASMAKLMSNSNPRLEVQIISGSRGEKVSVNNVNAMMLQKKEVSKCKTGCQKPLKYYFFIIIIW